MRGNLEMNEEEMEKEQQNKKGAVKGDSSNTHDTDVSLGGIITAYSNSENLMAPSISFCNSFKTKS